MFCSPTWFTLLRCYRVLAGDFFLPCFPPIALASSRKKVRRDLTRLSVSFTRRLSNAGVHPFPPIGWAPLSSLLKGGYHAKEGSFPEVVPASHHSGAERDLSDLALPVCATCPCQQWYVHSVHL